MRAKFAVLTSTLGLIASATVAGCDPGSDSVDDQRRATAGSEKPRDEPGGRSPDTGDEGLVDDDTFGEEGIIDDQTFGEDGVIPDDDDGEE